MSSRVSRARKYRGQTIELGACARVEMVPGRRADSAAMRPRAAPRPVAVASIRLASAERIGAGSAIDDSQLFACDARSTRASAETPRSGKVSSASRAARYTASATSRRPPSGALPASVASAANRKAGGWDRVRRIRHRKTMCVLKTQSDSLAAHAADIFGPWRNRRSPSSGSTTRRSCSNPIASSCETKGSRSKRSPTPTTRWSWSDAARSTSCCSTSRCPASAASTRSASCARSIRTWRSSWSRRAKKIRR